MGANLSTAGGLTVATLGSSSLSSLCLCLLLIFFFIYQLFETGREGIKTSGAVATGLVENPEALQAVASVAPLFV